jgi:hypothetical protein
MFSAWRRHDFRRHRYEPLATLFHAPRYLPVSVEMFLLVNAHFTLSVSEVLKRCLPAKE